METYLIRNLMEFFYLCTIEVELSFDLVKSSNFEWDSDVSDFRMDRQ